MNRTFKRTTALALALVFALALCAPALANNGDGETPAPVPASANNITIDAGEATLSATHIYIPVMITNGSNESVTLSSIINKTNNNSSVSWDGSATDIPAGGSVEILLTPTYSASNTGTITNTLVFNFNAISGKVTKYLNIAVNFGTPAAPDDPEAVTPAFRLSSYDANNAFVPAPSGNYGKNVIVRIPLLCLRSNIRNITIEPVLSTSLDSFPFEIAALDYTLTATGTPATGSILEFRYNSLNLAKKVTAGVKKVDFTVSWQEGGERWSLDGERQSMTISIYVNVVKGYVESTGTGGEAKPASKPKVILDSYSLSADKIYAGEQFDVTFTLRNTSETEDVKNIQISLSDTAEVGKLMPANNGSNTLYIAKIGKGETHTETISMQSAPDTEAKAYTLQLSFSYDGTSEIGHTAVETIAIPILQRIRIKVDDPVVYDDPWVGQSCALYFALYNMGKAPIYNCMVDVEGDGLEMEETYFGGTVAAGSTMRADFSIIPSVGGDIAGEIVITYEDVYGEQLEERIPLNLFVNEEMPYVDPPIDPNTGLPIDDPGMIDPGFAVDGDPNGGFPWVWVGVGAGVAAIGAAAVILLKKKRAKELEDV